MKNIIFVIALSLTLNINISQAAPTVGSGFTYQGELIDSGTGAPVTGDYDIQLDLYLELGGGGSQASLIFNNVTVTNGLFTIDDVDFGDAVYANHNQFYVEVAVKLAGNAGFDILAPRQRLAAVPYAVQAEFLAAGNASNGDVLQFDGAKWVAETLINMSQWLTTPGGTSLYTNERVGVGVTYPSAKLHVAAPVGENVFRVAQGTQIKLRVDPDNGGLSVGEAIVPPTDGLYVKGDIKQPMGSNGIPKFLVRGKCDALNSVMYGSVNNVNSGQVLVPSVNTQTGTCNIEFPSVDISNSFIISSAIESGTGNPRVINCTFNNYPGGTDTVICKGYGLGGTRRSTEFYLAIF